MNMTLEKSTQIMTDEIAAILGENLLSIYLYGSVVLDDFCLVWSDIDILVLTKRKICAQPAETLVGLRQALSDSLADIFGQTEKELVAELSDCIETKSYVNNTPIFFIDKDFNVYPNITTPAPHWKLGNLKTDGAEAVLSCYRNSGSPAQKARLKIPIGEMVRRYGDPNSLRLFDKNDYFDPIIKLWCEERQNDK